MGKGVEYEKQTMTQAYEAIMADLAPEYQGYRENPDQ